MSEKKEQPLPRRLDKVCIIGSGNWGSAISIMVGRNCQRYKNQLFEEMVHMWVYEEEVMVDDEEDDNDDNDNDENNNNNPSKTTKKKQKKKKLTHVMNERHENVKYLPGIRLPTNIIAMPDLAQACRGATLLIFVLPHQFLPQLLPTIRQSVHPKCRGVSLIKGLGKFRFEILYIYIYNTHTHTHKRENS